MFREDADREAAASALLAESKANKAAAGEGAGAGGVAGGAKADAADKGKRAADTPPPGENAAKRGAKSPPSEAQVQKLTVPELKEYLQGIGLSTQGTKRELVERVLKHPHRT